ncbi:MAG: peptidylprolyl isomerase [Clostridia bacterium]|nr:peptidylprolyl isomerase [Clostridia bacterium]
MANKKQRARAAAEAARKAQEQKTAKRNLILVIAAVLAVAAVALWAVLGGDRNPGGRPAGDYLTGKHYVQIEVQDYGVITAELDADAAPITVTNFVNLVNQGFYDGLTFHRIIAGFMIQGGDPLGNGLGGSDEKIWGEFAANGWDNPIKHERGVISMARSSAPDSASSQFFIMHQAAPQLDGSYAAFGRVLTGMEVVDAICQNTPVVDGNGTVASGHAPVITSIKVIEKPE